MTQQVERFLQSRQFDLYRKLGSKLLIEDESAQGIPPLVSRSVQPVVDVSGLLLVEDAAFVTTDISAAAGATIAYHTVPVGERWHLRWFVREVCIGSSRVLVTKARADLTASFTVLATAEQIGSFSGLIIEENDSIGLVTTGNGADINISLIILFGRELLN